jgi:acyl carrier protein
MSVIQDLKDILAETLQLGTRVETLTADSRVLGSMPEFDSMAVMAVIAAIEQHFGFQVDDDEISADIFATLGTMAAFIDKKLAS